MGQVKNNPKSGILLLVYMVTKEVDLWVEKD
jgi:hypothetical protein